MGPDTYLKHYPVSLARHGRKDVIANEDFIEQEHLPTMTTDVLGVKLNSADIFQTYDQSCDHQFSYSQAMIAKPHVYGFALM